MITKSSRMLKASLSYYTGSIKTWQLEKKIVLDKAFFRTFNKNEKLCLLKAQEIFGAQADFVDGFKQKESFVVLLKNSTFLGNTGVLVQNSKIIVESILDIYRMAYSKVYRKPSFLKSKDKKGLYTSIIHLNYSNNFYHWNIDCLPRLFNIKRIPGNEDINFIIREDMPQYQREVLSFFMEKDPRLKPVYISESEKWNIEKFWLPSFLTSSQSGFMPKANIEYVRDTVLEGYDIGEGEGKKPIYISRKSAKKRKLLNEDKIEELLEKLGVKIIQMENLSFKQQLHEVNQADVVISPHGAGLSNILYTKNIKVVEIHPSNYVQTHYCMLSNACDHDYFCYIGEEMDSDKNYQINIEKFKKFITGVIQ